MPKRDSRSAVGRLLASLGVLLAAPFITVAMITVHEMGHTLAAWAMGDWHAYFVIYQRVVEPNGSVNTCIGCNLYNSAKLGPFANVFVSLAGVGATAVMTWLAIVLLWSNRFKMRRWLLIEIAVICWLGDALWQVIQALPLGVPAKEPVGSGVGYTDFSAAGSFFAQATGWPRGLVEGLGLAASAAYLLATLAMLALAIRKPITGENTQASGQS